MTAAEQPEAGARRGLLAGGNFIIDHVKIIDAFPEQDMLVNIVAESRANGGGAYNVLKDLSRMGADFPLAAAGMLGADPDGDWIVADCEAAGIDTSRLRRTSDAATSYTDAMTVQKTGRRTFFHHRGANAVLAPEHFGFAGPPHRWFHLAYLMLLDTLDEVDGAGRSGASRVLEAASDAGLVTSADLVSVDQPDFRARVEPSLPFVDFLLVNEIEAGQIVGRKLADAAAMEDAARELLDSGVRRAVVIHCADGAVAVETDAGNAFRHGSLVLPDGFIKGATGAGDAFVAGCLFAWHDGAPTNDALRLGVCAAASSLTDPTPSDSVAPARDCLALADRFPARPF